MSAPARGAPTSGLDHLGLFYDRTEDLVSTATPHVRAALRDGAVVATFLDRATTRSLSDALGADASDVLFETPDRADLLPAGGVVRRIGSAGRGRAALVLTQYSAIGLEERDLTHTEAGINVMLADRSLTVMCACARSATPAHLDTAYRSHPRLVGTGSRSASDNPAFRAPDDHSPTPSATWGGRHALRLRFTGTPDLRRIRGQVERLALGIGLRGDAVRSAVLSVHEAAVVICDEAETVALALGSGERALCVLDVWTTGGHLVAEVAGPRGVEAAPRVGSSDLDVAGGELPPAARLPRNRFRAAGPLQYVRPFCREVAVRDSGVVRVVRVVTGDGVGG